MPHTTPHQTSSILTHPRLRIAGIVAIALAAATMAATPADARRGGSFGSRGARTYSAPATTNMAPNQVAPVQRSMTQTQPGAQAGMRQPGAAQARQPSRFGGLAGGLMGGLLAGGLIAALMGGGLGALGGSGMLMALLQAALIAGAIWFAIRLFRRKSPQPAFGVPGATAFAPATPFGGQNSAFTTNEPQQSGNWGQSAPAYAPPVDQPLTIDNRDKEAFERLLGEVQAAFGREDYAALRTLTTPEVMSYFAEELGQNATNGHRNDVTGTHLLEAEVSESWSEGSTAYATIVMRYESIDVMRDRATGAVVSGNATTPTQTTELWTFMRKAHGDWVLSAVQEA